MRGQRWVVAAVATLVLAAALAALAPRGAGAGELPDPRDARGFNLGDDRQQIAPGEEVSLFNGVPSYHRTLVSWPEPGGLELALTLDYSGAVPHHRFDFTPATGYADAEAAFGEWSLGLNGHVLWTGNLSEYLFNGEVPGQPHRDTYGRVVDGCWRTSGYSICDKAYAAGGSNADVEVATSDGGAVEFGYPGNVPWTGDPTMLPNDLGCAWRASLEEPARTGRTLRVKKPDGTTWTFTEVALTLRWPSYHYNMNQGPRAFRLSRIDGPVPDFHAEITYEYADSGAGRTAGLHPTAVHITDQGGRRLDVLVSANPGGGTCGVVVQTSYGYGSQVLSFGARSYTDRSLQTRRSSLYYLEALRDRVGRTTRFRYDNDDRSEAWVANCWDSLDVRARRLVGVDYPEGGGSSYSYLPLPSNRPSCPDPSLRYEDSSWLATGRSSWLAPTVARVEIREAAAQPPVQTLDFVYDWDQSPSVGAPSEAANYRYTTQVDFNGGQPLLKGAGGSSPGLKVAAARAPGVVQGFSVSHAFRKYPYLPQTYGSPAPCHWAARLIESSVRLGNGETHTLALDHDAVPLNGHYTGTLLPAARTYRVSAGAAQVDYATFTEYDSLARVTATTDLAGVRHTTEYFECPELHSPWSGSGRYHVELPSRVRRLAPGSGSVLSEAWYDRESVYGRTVAVHVRQDPTRVATLTFEYDPAAPAQAVRSCGAMGEIVDYEFATQSIPNTIYYAGCPGGGLPVHTVLHLDAGHTLEVFQSYGWEGELLREADGEGHIALFGYDTEGRPRTVARPGDVMTGPPPTPGRQAPRLPPYDLTPWPSTVFTYTDGTGQSAVGTALYPAMLDSVVSVAELDGLGRQRAAYPVGDPAARRGFEYDPFGRTARVTAPGSRAAGYGYDEMGRTVWVSGAAGGATTLERRTVGGLQAYGLNPPFAVPSGYWTVELRHHAGGRTTLRACDARGLLAAAAEYGSGSSVPLAARYYESDALGLLVAVHASDGSVTRFDYDASGRRRHTVGPDGSRRTIVYDRSGRPVLVQDENGAADLTWTYFRLDAVGRVLERGSVSGLTEADAQYFADKGALPPAARWTARYTHDTNATSFFPGCLTRAEARRDSGQADACDYACDERKRVTRKTLTFAGLARSLTVRYEYDRLDRLTALTYPDGRRLEFAYDAVGGRMARVTERSTGRTLVSVTRDVAARPVALRNGALDVAWEYGSEGHLARQAGGSVGRTLFEERFEYDPDGRCSALVGPGGVRTDYERDLAARLSAARFSSEPGAPRVSYGYAAGGGLDSVGSALEDVAFSLSGSRVLEFLRRPLGRESLEYDAHGSVVRRVRLTGLDTLGVLELRYSGDHQLVAVVGRSGESSDSARYGYDACGWRVRRESTGRRTYQVRDEDGNLLAEVDSAGATVRDFVRVEGRVLGAFEAGGAYVAYLTDASGSVRLGVDDRGAVRFRQDFLPYGEPVRFEGEERPTLGFLGAEQDPETGYCYLKNRFYDPAMGRFLSPDPLRDSGASPYAYGLDDPLTFADPDGLAPDPVDQPVHVPRYWLAPVVVEATHGVPVHLLVSLRILRTVCGNDAERIAGQLYRDGVAVARAWRSMRDGLRTISGRKLARQAAAGLRRHLPAAPRILLRTTLTNPTVSHVLDRAMVMHELVAGLRVILALEKARGLTPQERDVIKLKAETVLLGETTADLVALAVVDLGMVDPPVGLAALITWGGMRGDVSDLSDSILARAVPGYAQTSVLDELFGPLLDDVPP